MCINQGIPRKTPQAISLAIFTIQESDGESIFIFIGINFNAGRESTYIS